MSRYKEYDPVARRIAGERRSARLYAARQKGSHTKQEWSVLHDIFGACVSCGISYVSLNGGEATKDHIHAVVGGGCDCIANLQPVCRQCNSRGIGSDLRFDALPGWQTIYLHKMGSYF